MDAVVEPWPLPPPRDPVLPGKCFGCRMPAGACFCADIPVVRARTRVVIVRHCNEINRTSNPGRVAARVLQGSVVVDHGLEGQPLDLTGALGPDAWVLAPGPPPPPNPTVRTLVVLDGTWSQVKGMRRRIPPLQGLPALSLPAPARAPLRMRRGETPDQLATIEAIAAALELLGEPEPAAALRDVFTCMATRMRDLRGFDVPAATRRSRSTSR